jgi:hypothetical protein
MRHRHKGLVDYHTRRGNLRKRKKPIHNHNKITKEKRKVFTDLAKRPYEIGGQKDFERGDLKNIKAYFGNESELEYEYDPDFEISYHTHPPHHLGSIMPSYDDLLSMKETNEREQVIYFKNLALSVYEQPKFQNINKKKLMKVSDMLQSDYEQGISDKEMYKKYKPIFKNELGLLMTWHKPNSEIKLRTKSI